MIRLLSPLLLALSSSAAEPAPIEAYLAQAQATLEEIDRVVEAVGTGPGRAEAACLESFAADAVLEGLRGARVPAAAFSVLQPLREGLTAHLSCKAFAADEPAFCRGLEPLATLPAGNRAALPPHYLCRRDYQTWAYDLARASGGPDLIRRCLDENKYRWPGDEGPFRLGSEEAVCGVVADYRAARRTLAQACAGLGPHFEPPVSAEECARRVRWFFGEEPALCDGLRSEVGRARCREIADTRRAFSAGAVAPRDCLKPLKSARAAYCGRFSLDYAWRLHADLSVLLERAADLLAAGSGKSDSLNTRLARLESRRQDLIRALGRDASTDMGTLALPGAAFASVDQELARAHALVLGYPLTDLLERVGDGKVRPDGELLKRLEGYLGCLALVLDGPGACALLEIPALKAGRAHPPDYRCRHNYLMWNSDLARISGRADAPARCIAENYYRWRDPFDGGPFKPGAFREGCGLLRDYSVNGLDLRRACEKVLPSFRYSQNLDECVKRFRYAHGEDRELCYTLENPRPKLDRCLDLVALHGAVRDGKTCGESSYCRMQLERVPQSCVLSLDEVRRVPGAAAKLIEGAERRLEGLKGVPAGELEKRRDFIAWLKARR